MYCWVISPFFHDIFCFFLLVIFTHWLSFTASFTLIRPTFVWTRELVVISTTCIHSCRKPLSYSYVCPNCCMFHFLSLSDWHVCLRLSGHEYFGHATNSVLELLSNSVLQCPECNPFETNWTDCSNKLRCVWQRRNVVRHILIIVLFCMYLSLFCLGLVV